MSKPRKVNGTCGRCHASFDVTIWDSINTELSPDLPQRIISGDFFKHKCPKCGSVSLLAYPVLYHDLKHRAMIWVVLDGDGDKSRMDEIRGTFVPGGYLTRIVRSVGELREKVSILEANRDDRIIEIIKLGYLGPLTRQFPDMSIEKIIYWYNNGNERIVVCDKDGAETIVQFDSNAYERAKKIYADFLKQEVKGTYPVIDATWALDVIEKFEKQKVQVPDFTGLLDQWLLEEQKKNLTKSDVSQQAQKKEDQSPEIPDFTALLDSWLETQKAETSNTSTDNNLPEGKKHAINFCHKCGEKLFEDSSFCHKCGTLVLPRAEQPSAVPRIRNTTEDKKIVQTVQKQHADAQLQVKKESRQSAVKQPEIEANTQKRGGVHKFFTGICVVASIVAIFALLGRDSSKVPYEQEVVDDPSTYSIDITEKRDIFMNVGAVRKVKYTSTVGNPELVEIVWTSSDTSVATVSDTGVIKAKDPGRTTITVSIDGNKMDSCVVEVVAPQSSVSNSASEPDNKPVSVQNGQMIIWPDYRGGSPEVTVNAPRTENCFVYFENLKNSKNSFGFYVSKGSSATVNAPAGTYQLYYATGSTWYGKDIKFGTKTSYYTAPEKIVLSEDSTSYDVLELTLYAVANGNMDTDPINESDFPI